ncbi:MAG: bacillithiol biosynthesis cysteine-adding enzyme BshC [Cyclobacteriaceae bacterium]|nr:bacillithiol biosynthesis cysteine-adding enzyme BshC [Cyclobacteriaceae bacterium]
MDCIKLDFKETGLFSKLMVDYVEGNPKLDPFYAQPPTLKGFKKAIKDKLFNAEFRLTLVEVLKDQYARLDTSEKVKENIEALGDSKTFTVTTGHQLNIFTGPLFYIYKLVATINLAKSLKKAYPSYHFVPVYWMGSEDHDYEEINHLYIHNKKYEWQTNQRGATGKFSTEGLEELLATLPGRTQEFKEALKKNSNLSDVVRYYVNAMFGNQGLVCLDADDARLKKEFLPVIKDELFKEQSHRLVEEQSAALENAGYKQQLQPRELNLFYMDEGLRARIVKKGDAYSVVDTDLKFTTSEISSLLKTNPERFSPNVILRPVYQETILPNLAYVGGPSELAYWFQLKSVFDHFKLAFPILMPRSFVMYIGAASCRKIEKLGVKFKDLFLREDLFINKYIKSNSNGQLKLGEAKEALASLYAGIKIKAKKVDTTLAALVESEQLNVLKSIDRVEHKMLKAEKRNRADELRMLHEIYASLYPGGVPHERRENILSVENATFIKELLKQLNPLELKYTIIKATD